MQGDIWLRGMYTPPKKRLLSVTLKKTHFNFNAGHKQSSLQARCAASCARNHSFVRARRELLLSKDLRLSLLTWGVCSKRRAHFNFNAGCKQRFSQARCAASCALGHSFVRARRGPLDDQVNPGHGLFRFLRPRSGSSEVKNYQYQNILDRFFKIKTLIV